MKLKILFIIHFPPPIHGSAIVGNMIKESRLINNSFNCKYINLSTSSKVEEIGTKSIQKIINYILTLCNVFSVFLKWKPDLCYIGVTVTGPAFYKDLMMVTLAKLFRVRLVYHCHNKGVSESKITHINNLFYRFAFKNVQIILLSKYLFTDIEKYVSENSVHYCANGVNEIKIRHKLNLNNDVPQILFLSNLFESKGVFVLLDACKILYEKGIIFHCNYVGNCGDITECEFRENVKRLNIQSQITYLGAKFGEEKRHIMDKSDIFVHPTYNDCFPLVLIEAMQHSLPIISTFEGGIPEIIENGVTGFLVEQKNVVDLAERLEALIDSPDLRSKLGKAGRTKFEKEFTLTIFEKKLCAILKSIVSSNNK